ncbi:MAG: potassium/proton antiporter [Bacteroidales bacterium]|nr:potassium/proton antiporter [Bacteroidales bacterium]
MNLISLLILSAIVIVLCVILNRISNKIGIPMLLGFMLLGMVFGSDGIISIEFNNFNITEDICTVALIFIMFYGGFGTRWKEARPVVVKAGLLASIGVFLTALLTGLFCIWVLDMEPLFGFLIGSVLSSTDAASVFSILRSRKLGLKYNTASLLEIESGSNDPCSYMLTAIMISMITGDSDSGGIGYMIFSQIVYGSLIGVAIAIVSSKIMKRFGETRSSFDELFVFAVAILSYALPSIIGGNGYLSAYIVGIILGNADIKDKKTLVPFFDGINGLMQVVIFFLLGLLVNPSELPEVLLPAALIAIFMALVARPISIFSILTPFKSKLNQQGLVSFVGLRGAASIVFAIMATPAAATISGVGEHTLFNIVFTVVIISILVQGSLIPGVSRKLKMIDKDEDIMKTFTDYSQDNDIEFVQVDITAKDPWRDKTVKDLPIPHDMLIAVIVRDSEIKVPSGKTKILEGDKVIMTAKNYNNDSVIHLSERIITPQSGWVGKKVFQYSPNSNELIVLIKRGDETIIPRGNTILSENDILVVNEIQPQSK